jgi:tetratricopeptide (TPR) repeat protein
MLMLDADDEWVADEGFTWPPEDSPAFHVQIEANAAMGKIHWYRPALIRCNSQAHYQGVAHEALVGAIASHRLYGAKIVSHPDGHRRRTEGQDKYHRIAAILEREWETNPSDPRTTFYLAQSYRDGGRFDRALEFYRKRIRQRGWKEERWYATYQVACMLQKLDAPFEEVIAAYQKAYERNPHRGEPLVDAAAYCRRKNRPELAAMYASTASLILPVSQELLFVDQSVHWRALDELAAAAFDIGRIDLALETLQRLLDRDDVPEHQLARLQDDLEATAREARRVIATARKT